MKEVVDTIGSDPGLASDSPETRCATAWAI